MVGPSPRYIDDEGYAGGFSAVGAAGIAEAVVNEAVAFQSGLPRDDIAVVVLKIPA